MFHSAKLSKIEALFLILLVACGCVVGCHGRFGPREDADAPGDADEADGDPDDADHDAGADADEGDDRDGDAPRGDADADDGRDGSVEDADLDSETEPPSPLSCTHYASPDGGGDGLTLSNPMSIADFWSVAAPGDTLCLTDGIYRGDESMIHPPSGLSGTEEHPITVAALHDGEVFIDGEGERGPLQLDENNWFILEGFDLGNALTRMGSVENSVAYVEHSHHVVLRRLVGWNAADGNTHIFGSNYSQEILFEDVAGFGVARKIFQLGHRSDSMFDETDQHIVARRVFARLERSSVHDDSTCGQGAISVAYNTNGNIVENAIATVSGYLGVQPGCPGAPHHQGIFDDRPWDLRNQILGSIVFRLPGQSVAGSPTQSLLYADSAEMTVRDVLIAVEGLEATYGEVLRATTRLNTQRQPGFEARNLTLIGGPGSWLDLLEDTSISHLIATNATWNEGASPVDQILVPATALLTVLSSRPPTDYVMAWNNGRNWNVEPTHFSVEDPDLVGRCGNLLQYGCSDADRPTVAGEPVGAQIQCRYVDGVLTDQPLWPWPMEERIRVATCMYDNVQTREYCQAHPDLGVHVTRTVFELGGGHVPDFAALNPILCPNRSAADSGE